MQYKSPMTQKTRGKHGKTTVYGHYLFSVFRQMTRFPTHFGVLLENCIPSKHYPASERLGYAKLRPGDLRSDL
jgi:hypothetical protein